jgi:hypothetical protein
LKIHSGVTIKNVSTSKTFQLQLKEVGEIGRNGVHVHEHAVLEYQFKQDHVTIQHQHLVVNFVLVKELATRHATLVNVLMMNRASEHSNAQRKTAFQLKRNTLRGFHI